MHAARVARLGDVRNQYLHYKWRGYLPAAHEQQLQILRSTVEGLDASVAYFKRYYATELEEPYERLAIDAFAVSAEDLRASS